MVRMIYCVMRKESVSLREFRNYFDGEHQQLICNAAKAMKAVDFKQSLTLMVEQNFMVMVERGTGMPYDGVIEIWWDNAAELNKVIDTEAVKNEAERIFRQADHYIDMARSRIFFTEQPRSCNSE